MGGGGGGGAGLRLNASKTKAIMFDSKMGNIVNDMNLPGIEMHSGVLIPFSSEVVSPGVTLDNKLSWKPHINQVVKKVNKALYSLRFIWACTSETLRKRLVEALVQPHLDYCVVVYLDATNEQWIRLQRLHNSCVRYVFGVRRDVHITPFRKRLGWLRVQSRKQYHAALCMYKILRIKEPSYLAAPFTEIKSRPTFRGVPPELVEPARKSDAAAGSFQIQGVILWNSLPPSLRHLPSLSSFHRALRQYLFELDP